MRDHFFLTMLDTIIIELGFVGKLLIEVSQSYKAAL